MLYSYLIVYTLHHTINVNSSITVTFSAALILVIFVTLNQLHHIQTLTIHILIPTIIPISISIISSVTVPCPIISNYRSIIDVGVSVALVHLHAMVLRPYFR